MQTYTERYETKFRRSKALYQEALKTLPRGVTHDARFMSPFPIYVSHGRGSHEWDVDGYEYIDYYGGHGALMLGHAHPSLVDAISLQVCKGTHYGASHELEIEWASLIQKLVPCAELVEFTNSGTESNTLAMRLARAFTGRNKIIRFEDHFHGWSEHLMVGLREPWNIPMSAGLLPADSENTIVIPINEEALLQKALATREVAMVIVEAGGAHSGVSGITPQFYQAMRQLTKEYGALLHFDEVVTGFRYSPGGVQALKGITPDLTSLGKTITGGIAGAGAVVGRADIMNMLLIKDDTEWNRYKRVSHSGTFNANPLCAAAGAATLKILATGEPQSQANKMTRRLLQGMRRAMDERGLAGCAYGEASIWHLYFGKCEMQGKCDRKVCLNVNKIRKAEIGRALNINLALNGVHNPVRGVDGFTSAVHTEEDIDKTIEAFQSSLDTMIAEGVLQRS